MGIELFKTSTTKHLYEQFIDSYQTASQVNSHSPFVFVDQDGIRLISSVMSESENEEEVVAISVYQDGLMVILALD